jgi:hypothetical protein
MQAAEMNFLKGERCTKMDLLVMKTLTKRKLQDEVAEAFKYLIRFPISI